MCSLLAVPSLRIEIHQCVHIFRTQLLRYNISHRCARFYFDRDESARDLEKERKMLELISETLISFRFLSCSVRK